MDVVQKSVEIVVEQMLLNTNAMKFEKVGKSTALADANTLATACALWNCVAQRLVCDLVMRELRQRKLASVTVHTLSILVCAALAHYKPV